MNPFGGGAALRLAILLVVAMSFPMHSALGAEWSIEPSARLRTEYTDNVELVPESGTSTWGIIVGADARFGYRTETVELVGGIAASVNRYPDDSELDATNYALTLRSTYQHERDLFRLNVDAIRDATLVSELEETGTVLAYRQRNFASAQLSWTRQLSETSSIAVGYTYSRADYGDTAGTSLIDYSMQVATLAWQNRLDERSDFTATAYYEYYSTHPSQFVAKTYGVRAAYGYTFSETLRGSVSAGWRDTRSTLESNVLVCEGFVLLGACFGTLTELNEVLDDRSSGYTLDAFIEKRTERDVVSARVSRQLNPSGNGALVQTDRVGAVWTQQLSPTLSATLDVAAYRTNNVGGTVTGPESRYYRVEPRFAWRITEQWELNGAYRYARQRYEGAATAEGNLVYVTLGYVWPRISMSR